MSTPATLLAAALRADPSRVLLTFYDDATGERAELSVTTFNNWVAKTANLCRDDLDLQVGDRVAIALPVHWQAAVWWQACWVSGLVGVPVAAAAPVPACDVAVVATADAGRLSESGTVGEVVGLGLGPMGLPVPGPPASGITLDYDRAVPGHGDQFTPPGGLSPTNPALATADGDRTAGDIAELAVAAGSRWRLSAGDRTLVATPFDDERSLLAGLLVPLAMSSAAVLCRHLDRLDDAALARRVAAEGVTAVTGLAARFSGSQPRHLD